MGNNSNHSQTCIDISYSISPLKNVLYNISGILGNFNSDLINNFYPEITGKRVNVIISELVNNVIENKTDENSKIGLKIHVGPKKILIEVKNKVNYKQFEKVKKHIEKIEKSNNPSKLLAKTIKKRRSKNLNGGLGLIRLVSENKAILSARYNKSNSYMAIISKLEPKI